jgi:glycosyltransferase involved in cell wall biosynthesis
LGSRRIAGRDIPPDTRIVTYVSRGFESMRGFDIFMRVAERLCELRRDVIFVCVGTDRICYGGDLKHIQEPSFREHVLNAGNYDLDRFIFTGRVPARELVRILSLSDLHVYLTVPFVLSWSMMNALACGCTVLASVTEPVEEMIRDGQNGLLAGFYDVAGFVERALEVLDSPEEYRRRLGRAGVEMIRQRYSLEKTLPQLLRLYDQVISGTFTGAETGESEHSGD